MNLENKMKRGLTIIALCLYWLMQGFSPANAKHLLGGETTFRYIGNNKYQVNFICYRDCKSGVNFIDSLEYGIFRGKDSGFVFGANTHYRPVNGTNPNHYTVKIDSASIRSITSKSPYCSYPAGYCFQEADYVDTVTLGNDSLGYNVLLFQAVRNSALVNIDQSTGPDGMAWFAHIPEVKYHDNSPQFLGAAVPAFCISSQNIYNVDAMDPDGDSLSFYLSVPLSPKTGISGNTGGTNPYFG